MCRMLLMRETGAGGHCSRRRAGHGRIFDVAFRSSFPIFSQWRPLLHPLTTLFRFALYIFAVSLEFPRFLAFLAVLNVPFPCDCMFQSTLVYTCIVQDGSASAPPKFFAPAGAHLGQAAPVCIQLLVGFLQKFLPLTLSCPTPPAHRRQRSPRCPSPNSSKR